MFQHLYLIENIESQKVEQPDIEFMATSLLGTVQTGKVKLKNLVWKAVVGKTDVEISYTPVVGGSPFIGDSLASPKGGVVYIDVDDESLSVGGWLTTEAFTIGSQVWVEPGFYYTWTMATVHNAAYDWENVFLQDSKWKFAIFVQFYSTPYFISLAFVKCCYTAYLERFKTTLSDKYRSAWVHVAYTYAPNENGGTLRVYINGNYTQSFDLSPTELQIGRMYDIADWLLRICNS